MADNDENEVFHDAEEEILGARSNPTVLPNDLDSAVEECRIAMNMYFNNEFNAAKRRVQAKFHIHPYYATSTSAIVFSQAIMTLEPEILEYADKCLENAIEVCHRFRKKETLTETFGNLLVRKADYYNSYTRDEIHAELCYGECITMQCCLIFFLDDTLMRFAKESVKLHSCLQSYRKCLQILQHRNWRNDPLKIHFRGGVNLVIGAYYLVMSMLPSKIAKLLQFVGACGTKEEGLQHLEKGFRNAGDIRHMVPTLFLLTYHLWVTNIVLDQEGNIPLVEEIVTYELEKFPNGGWMLLYSGRLQLIKGNFEAALQLYLQAWKVSPEMGHLHQVCFSELATTHILLLNWKKSATYLHKLLQANNWCMALYAYLWCSATLIVKDELTKEEKEKMEAVMSDIPCWKRQIAGYNLPLERVCSRKSKRYFMQGNYLPIPAIEYAYLFNGFRLMSKRPEKLTEMYKIIDKCLTELGNSTVKGDFYTDNVCLVHLLKGSCLKYLGKQLQAEQCFRYIYREQKNIKEDHYLVPFSLYEMATLLMSQKKLEEASQYLDMARNKYKDYDLEVQLQYRLNTAAEDLANLKKTLTRQ